MKRCCKETRVEIARGRGEQLLPPIPVVGIHPPVKNAVCSMRVTSSLITTDPFSPQDTPRNASSPDLKKQQEKKKKQKEKAPTRDIFHLRFPLLGIFGNLKHTV